MAVLKSTKERYGIPWEEDADDLEIEMCCIRRGGKWERNGKECGEGLFHHYRQMQTLLWPEDDHHRWSDLILKEILQNRITAIMGAKDCVRGDTRILNPITGEQPTIQYLKESKTAPMVMTMEGPIQAEVPFVKGREEMLEITCEDGLRFSATQKHHVLTDAGFVAVGSLVLGQRLVSYAPNPQESISELSLSVHGRGGLSSSQKVVNSRCDCFAYSCPDGERLQRAKGIFQGAAPSQVDAQEHGIRWREDGSEHNASHIHRHSKHARLSISDFFRLSNSSSVSIRFPLWLKTSGFGVGWCQWLWPFFAKESAWQSGATAIHGALRRRFSSTGSACGNLKVHRTAVQQIRAVGVHEVYDLTVPNVHHYFAEGTIHHNTGKTHGMAKYALCDYFCFPKDTLILMSSTDLRGLELRVWGDLKDLFVRAKDKYSWLAGKAVDHLHGVFTDDLSGEDEIRNLRRGILCIPCIGSDNRWTGLDRYVGIKQKRRRLLGDETNFMAASYFDTLANLNKGDFKGVFVGNPIGEGDPLDKIAEPKEGWETKEEPTKTDVWENKFPEGRTINLVGTDSPNFDEPKNRYPYLIDESDIAYIKEVWGPDSHEMYNQALGIRKPGLNARRVITREMCQNFGAHDKAIWGSDNLVKIYAVDAAYGGDRCVAGWCEWGSDVNNKQILRVQMPKIIPISVKLSKIPEDQIAEFIAQDCAQFEIPPSHVFHDSTGRGSLGTSIARIWSAETNPVEFGGNPTERPVCSDLFVWDEEIQAKRLKRCDEHYSKFVTELWFSVRYAIEGRQMRELPKEVMEEGCSREWMRVKKDKIEVESKVDTKKRMGRSPDLFDWLSIIVEGARRLGFQIARLENEQRQFAEDYTWKKRLRQMAVQLRTSYALDYKA